MSSTSHSVAVSKSSICITDRPANGSLTEALSRSGMFEDFPVYGFVCTCTRVHARATTPRNFDVERLHLLDPVTRDSTSTARNLSMFPAYQLLCKLCHSTGQFDRSHRTCRAGRLETLTYLASTVHTHFLNNDCRVTC